MTDATPPEVVKTSRKRSLWIIVGILSALVIIAAIVVILLVMRQRNAQSDLERERTAVEDLQSDVQDLRDRIADETAVTPTPSATPRVTSTPSPTPTQESLQSKSYTDTAKLYSMRVPTNWTMVTNEGAIGVQKSRVSFDTPDYAYHTDPAFEGPFEPIYYDEGASFTVHVTMGEGSLFVPSSPIRTKSVVIDGVAAKMYAYKEPSTFGGEILEVNLNYGGNQYLFRMAYNPETYAEGQTLFEQILATVEFL